LAYLCCKRLFPAPTVCTPSILISTYQVCLALVERSRQNVVMHTSNHYVFAGGGTGGHLYPGLAVAAAVRSADPDAQITFLTTTRQLDRDLLGRSGFGQIPQPVGPFTVHPLRIPRFLLAWRQSIRLARREFESHKPLAVLGLGGYAAGPGVVTARKMGIRTAILNPDAIPGRANRYLARFADLIVLQWDASKAHFASGAPCDALGCPIRAEFAAPAREEGLKRFSLSPERPVLLVTGASQGARTINEAMTRVWPDFHAARPDWQLVHLTGPADETLVREAYAARSAPACVLAFTHEMPLLLAAADLVVARAGASTLAELTALGKPAILMPYPFHRDQHQYANARVLADAGAARIVADKREAVLNSAALHAVLEEMAPADVRLSMSQAAAALGRPRAAEQIAAWLRGAGV
jgi:UDP-N-acetylglucosamine--N-acetylmuramyl-(pentapeptide) pyrophosphoryl-undecaprenol N-acetylglucosamine transferase